MTGLTVKTLSDESQGQGSQTTLATKILQTSEANEDFA